MTIEEIAKQIYPDVDGYLGQIEHDRIQFIRGYNYAKENECTCFGRYICDNCRKEDET